MYIILINLLINFFYYFINPIKNIAFDEAYYWVYSNNFEWSYCSKPPIIAWQIMMNKYLFPNNNYMQIRFSVLFNDILFFVLAYYLFSIKYVNLIILTFTNIFLFKKFVFTTDSLLLIGNLITFGSLNNLLLFQNNYWWIGITFGSIFSIYSKQMGLIFPLIVLYYTGFNYLYLGYFIISLASLIPFYLNEKKTNFPMLNHTKKSNISNNISNTSIINGLTFIFEQIFYVGPFILLLYHEVINFNYLLISIFPLLLLSLISFKKRVNTNWTNIFWTNLILFANINSYNNYYLIFNFTLFSFLSIIFKICDFKVKEKIDIYPDLMNQLEKEIKINNINKIAFLQCRKLGSYIWFYTNKKPLKININDNPLDQWDLWLDSIINYENVGLLLQKNEQEHKIRHFKIDKKIKMNNDYHFIIYKKI